MRGESYKLRYYWCCHQITEHSPEQDDTYHLSLCNGLMAYHLKFKVPPSVLVDSALLTLRAAALSKLSLRQFALSWGGRLYTFLHTHNGWFSWMKLIFVSVQGNVCMNSNDVVLFTSLTGLNCIVTSTRSLWLTYSFFLQGCFSSFKIPSSINFNGYVLLLGRG